MISGIIEHDGCILQIYLKIISGIVEAPAQALGLQLVSLEGPGSAACPSPMSLASGRNLSALGKTLEYLGR